MLFTSQCSVARLSPTSDNNDKESYATVIPSIRINIQPATAELVAVAEGVFGQTYQAFVTHSGIQVGDRLTASGSNIKYIVKGVSDWNYGPLPHLELILFKGDN